MNDSTARDRASVAVPLELPPLEAVAELSANLLPALLVHLAALQAAIAARLTVATACPDSGPDRLLTVKQAAPILGMSEDWLYRNAGRLPFTRRTGRRSLRFSERALKRYLADAGP